IGSPKTSTAACARSRVPPRRSRWVKQPPGGCAERPAIRQNENPARAELKGRVSGTLMPFSGIVKRGLRLGNIWPRQRFPLCDQLRFSRRFARLLTRGGLRIGNAARNNFAAVFDDFPIPATVL